MRKTIERIAIYGCTALLSGGLLWGGFGYRADADLMTLVNGAEVRLRLAATLPARDKAGAPTAVRADLVRQAREQLDKAYGLAPDHAPAAELRAFAYWVEGEHEKAARAYAGAQRLATCTPELRECFAVNEARMWRAASRPAQALAALDQHGKFAEPELQSAELERMQALLDLGRQQDAAALAAKLAFAQGQKASVRLEAGACLERIGQWDQAERAYQLTRNETVEGAYALARLKLARGDVDTSMELLGECVRKDGKTVRGLVRADPQAWRAAEADARFQKICGEAASAPQSGR